MLSIASMATLVQIEKRQKLSDRNGKKNNCIDISRDKLGWLFMATKRKSQKNWISSNNSTKQRRKDQLR